MVPGDEEEKPLPCADKLVYDTAKEAQTAATVLRFQRNILLKAYHCQHCGLWHLASNYEKKP